jgi:hypothetical protein
MISDVRLSAGFEEVLESIRQAGYEPPVDMAGDEIMMKCTADKDEYDASEPGGLKIAAYFHFLSRD